MGVVLYGPAPQDAEPGEAGGDAGDDATDSGGGVPLYGSAPVNDPTKPQVGEG